jgi:putative phosphoesterase
MVKLSSEIKAVGVIADIHSNIAAARCLFERESDIGQWVCAGDFLTMWAKKADNENMTGLFRENKVISVLGNHEKFIKEVEAGAYSAENSAYINELPLLIRLRFANKILIITHASPANIQEVIDENISDEKLFNTFKGETGDMVIFGHSHKELFRRIRGKYFINPGLCVRGDGSINYYRIDADGEIVKKSLSRAADC